MWQASPQWSVRQRWLRGVLVEFFGDTKIRMVSELFSKWYRLTMSLKNFNAHNYSISSILRRLEHTSGNPLSKVLPDVDLSSYFTGTSEFLIVKYVVVLIQNKQPQLDKKHEQIDNHICL